MEELETISESLLEEANELESYFEGARLCINDKKQLASSINNFKLYSDRLYKLYENDDKEMLRADKKKLYQENKILKELLREKTTFKEQLDLRIKYGIDVNS